MESDEVMGRFKRVVPKHEWARLDAIKDGLASDDDSVWLGTAHEITATLIQYDPSPAVRYASLERFWGQMELCMDNDHIVVGIP